MSKLQIIVLILLIALAITFIGNCDNKENFADEKKKYRYVIKDQNNEYELVAYSQLKPRLQKHISKEYIDLGLMGLNDYELLYELADLKDPALTDNDIIFAINKKDLEKLSNNESVIGYDENNNIIYIDRIDATTRIFNNPNKRIGDGKVYKVKNLLSVTNVDNKLNKEKSNQLEEVVFDINNNKISNKFIDLKEIKINGDVIYNILLLDNDTGKKLTKIEF